jgi:hypothetical protein
MFVYDKLRRRHAGAEDALGTDVEARHGEAAESPLQVLERQAGIEHRAERSLRDRNLQSAAAPIRNGPSQQRLRQRMQSQDGDAVGSLHLERPSAEVRLRSPLLQPGAAAVHPAQGSPRIAEIAKEPARQLVPSVKHRLRVVGASSRLTQSDSTAGADLKRFLKKGDGAAHVAARESGLF